MAFIDQMRAEGHAVESVCRVLREQGCQVAARTYRAWRQPDRLVAARTVTDAIVKDQVLDLAWTVDEQGRRRLTPEGLYGRRKVTALVRRSLPDARGVPWMGRCAPWTCTASVVVPRAYAPRSRLKNGIRARDLLNRDFTALALNRTWVMDFTGQITSMWPDEPLSPKIRDDLIYVLATTA